MKGTVTMTKTTNINKEKFISDIKEYLKVEFQRDIKNCTIYQMHTALSKILMGNIIDKWVASEKKYSENKQACYFSAEFLVGRAIYNNLLALGLTEEIGEALREKGVDLSSLEDIEDEALGNGGLGRLAACFLDSAVNQDYPLKGYGIRYKYGIFKQRFEDGFQIEEADHWTKHGDPWSYAKASEEVLVKFADQKVRAVPYDMPIIGFHSNNINTLRLWQAEALEDFDFQAFNNQDYDLAVKEKNRAEDISRVLYPNDSNEEGRILRIKQQYFFCSASLQDILRNHIKTYGGKFDNLPEKYAIQLNDTHPVVAIPELIRILVDEYKVSFNKALTITQKVFSYTNHTVMAEALEKWDCYLYKKILPRIYEIIEKIHKNLISNYKKRGGKHLENLKAYMIIRDDKIHMANLAIYGSSYINGVAALHTEILKTSVLKEWYEIRPESFQNKTNGITQRRWLALCNPNYSKFITDLLGTNKWIKNLHLLKGLEKYEEDKEVLRAFMAIKTENKRKLAAYILKQEGVEVDPGFIFDIQIKRLHEYKRQFLNGLSLLDIYFGLKDGRIKDFNPTAFIFGAKAAPGYLRAKGIIKFINEIAKLINNDTTVQDKLKVIFVQNYNVSYAEKLVSAADISEQISTAGTEASGTGNMKFMLNGAVTLGTYDGANVEIVEEAGFENNYIFGARVEDIRKIENTYDPLEIYKNNPRIKKVLDTIIDGTFSDGGTGIFEELYNSILKGASWHKPDHYYLLLDFESYIDRKLEAIGDYSDRYNFARKCFHNTANAGSFSSDRTIEEYARDIWHIKKVF
jgi:glycogen phosphorylase